MKTRTTAEQTEQRMVREAEDTAQRFLTFVDDASRALFPGVQRYNDLTEDEKAIVRAFIALLQETDEVVH